MLEKIPATKTLIPLLYKELMQNDKIRALLRPKR